VAVTEFKISNQVVLVGIRVKTIVCESRKNTLPYPFGSTTEFKIRWWADRCVKQSRKNTLPYPFGSTTEFKIRWWG
jgi:hypothetical protein